jgi:hypothetical protein
MALSPPIPSLINREAPAAARVLEVIMVRGLEVVIAGTSEEERKAETMVALGQE